MQHRTVLAALLTLSTVGSAHAEAFGDQGTIVPRGAVGLSHTRFAVEAGTPDLDATVVTLAPEVSYFVVDRWAVGLGLIGTALWMGDGRGLLAGLRLSTAYYLPMSTGLGFLPEVGAAVTRSWYSGDITGPASPTLYLQASFPLLIHSDHFFIGFGPSIVRTVSFDDIDRGSLAFEMTSTLGGWL